MAKQHHKGSYTYTNHRSLYKALEVARSQSPDAKVFINARFNTGSGPSTWRTVHGLSRPNVYDYYVDSMGYTVDLEDFGYDNEYMGGNVTGYQVWVA